MHRSIGLQQDAVLRMTIGSLPRSECISITDTNMYSAKLLDHFEHPRNAGELESADAVAELSNPVCGDVMRLSLKVRAGLIQEIRFKAKGCVPSMACGSALTELVRGKNVAEVRRLRREELVDAVGGLPQASNHAAQLALDVLSAAVRQLLEEKS